MQFLPDSRVVSKDKDTCVFGVLREKYYCRILPSASWATHELGGDRKMRVPGLRAILRAGLEDGDGGEGTGGSRKLEGARMGPAFCINWGPGTCPGRWALPHRLSLAESQCSRENDQPPEPCPRCTLSPWGQEALLTLPQVRQPREGRVGLVLSFGGSVAPPQQMASLISGKKSCSPSSGEE